MPLLVAVLMVTLSGCVASPPIHHRLVTELEAAKALEVAKAQLGSPYEWGGRRPPAFDSSGIITWSYRQAIPRLKLQVGPRRIANDARHQEIYQWNFQPLPLAELRPGDLVYITDGSSEVTHGAMFVEWIVPNERMRFLDASSRIDPDTEREIGVTIQEWPVNEEVRGQSFVAAGRLKIVR